MNVVEGSCPKTYKRPCSASFQIQQIWIQRVFIQRDLFVNTVNQYLTCIIR